MNQLFRKLTLPVKLMLIGLVPLVFLLYLAIEVHNEKTEKIEVLDKFMGQVTRSTNVSTVVDELQSERRLSFGYVLQKQTESKLAVQREKTDEALTNLERETGITLAEFKTYTFLDELPQMRTKIDQGKADPEELMAYYTATISRLAAVAPVSSENINYLQPIVKEQNGQKLLSEMISLLGAIRTDVYYSMFTRQDAVISGGRIKGLANTYSALEKEFLIKSSEKNIKDYQQAKQMQELKMIFHQLNTVRATGLLDTNYNADEWLTVSARGIDKLKEIQRKLVAGIEDNVKQIYESEKTEKDRNVVALVCIIALVMFVIFYTTRNITATLNELRAAAEKIARGESVDGLKIETNDVIGSLAKSILLIDQNNKALAQAAFEIGRGNFDVSVQPRSNEDMLGNAISRMKFDLQKFTLENEEKIWIQSGLAEVNKSVRGERDLLTLSKQSLATLVSYTDAQVGMFYVSTPGESLEYMAGHAVTNEKMILRQIPFGQTIVGQAAEKKELLHLRNVPDEFVKISSASGNTNPRHLIVLPLVHNDVVEGVVELASLDSFTEESVSLLNQAASNIAIALHAAKSRAKLQELLEETQSQAEELQTQHSELENLNTELEAQAQKLQASEEELKVQQEELLQANQELEENTRTLEEKNQLIVERNLDIQRKAEELALSTKYKSEFLANMSHELRTPLNSILLLSRLMSENNEKNLTTDQVEYAQVIQSSGHGLLALIDEILDLSKIESGKMDLEYANVPVNEILNDMRMLFQPIANEKNLEFNINVAKEVPEKIETDKMRLEQILKNLLSNALKFTSAGSITLSVNKPVNDLMIHFSVKDTGIGIPKEKQQLIFEAFQQADGSTRRKFGGTGLGLSISRELAKLLGGEIILKSETDQGSEFTVSIPVSKDLVEKRPTEKEKTEDILSLVQEIKEEIETTRPESNKEYTATIIPQNIPDDRNSITASDRAILIVEDDVNFAKSLLDYTRKRNYRGIVAVRGDEGIELARKYNPLGILLDIQLPVKNGWEVMEELKNDAQTRHIPVHIMSSYEVKRESLIKGAVDFINKPVAYEQMPNVFEKIEQVFSNNPRKVLIIEENPMHAKALAGYLDNFSVNTEIKSNVNEGITALKKDSINCVILDMGIPDQKSYDTLEEVKKDPALENLPIIIFTGKSLSKAEEQKIKQYADSIVIKTAHSYQRILDEVSLFLHIVEESRQESKTNGHYRKLGMLTEVLKGKKVLITDDDVRNIFSLTKALESLKIEVITAMDGKEALKQLEEHPDTDLVLMDMMMPEMDGYESTSRIRQNPRFRNLPVIAVTAKAMTGDREKCIKAGASDYITKPVDIDQLLSLLRVWLYER